MCAEVPPTPHHVDRNKCAHRGCHRKFNWMSLADMKHSFTRHYCSICQNVYCHRHTHYSPHGNLGSCGMESKCICQTCFAALPKVSQVRPALDMHSPRLLAVPCAQSFLFLP